jgi:hypothetical protein
MRRRKVLATAGAALGLFAFTGIAMAAPSPPAPTPNVPLATGKYQTAGYVGISTGTAKFKPAGSPNGEVGFVSGYTKPSGKLLNKRTWKNVAMSFRTATGNGSYPGTGIPDPAIRAQVVFSSNLKFNIPKAAPCAQSAVAGLSTALAKAACPNSIVGGGVARIRVPGFYELFGETQVELTAFRGETDTAGNPTVILFSRAESLGTGSALIGTLVNKPSWASGRDYGKMLDVFIPLLASGTTALTQFEMTIGNGYKPGFIQAKCVRPTFKSSSKFYFSTKDQEGGGADPNADSYLPAGNRAVDSKKCG